MIVVIPHVRRLGVVAIQFKLIAITVQVEHVRVAIAVGIVCNVIRSTANLVCHFTQEIHLYFTWEHDSTSTTYQVDFFF